MRKEDDALRALVENKLLGYDTEYSPSWTEYSGGVFVTGFKDANKKLTSDNVWCCMSNGEYDGKQSVWINTQEAIQNCLSYDSRRTNNNPETYEISILTPRSNWRKVVNFNILCNNYRSICVKSGDNFAIYLPSVWYEFSHWTARELVENLMKKAKIKSEDKVEVYEIGTYTILSHVSFDRGFFSDKSNFFCHYDICNHERNEYRNPSHLGTWYQNINTKIDCEYRNARIIISPHAAYKYSGDVAKCAYASLNKNVKRVFILGPSHFHNTTCCETTSFEKWNNTYCDMEVIEELMLTGKFSVMSTKTDLKEHSLEMQVIFINEFLPHAKIVPILVGNLDQKSEEYYGILLSSYLDDEDTAFVISTDFTHYGPKFNYTPFSNNISERIRELDYHAIDILINQDVKAWNKLESTICGKHALAILLYAFQYSNKKYEIELLKYHQNKTSENSVSYCALAAIEL